MHKIIVPLLVLLAALQYKLWFGDGGVMAWRHIHQELKENEHHNEKLVKRNQAILADIEELRQGDQALEEQARTELGMIRSDETYYQLVE